MNLVKKIIVTTVALLITINAPLALAKDKEYKFTVKGHVSEKIIDKDDFAMLKASEYALKKGYDYFTVENIRRYEKKKKGSSRIGARNSNKKDPRTEIKIHCYDEIAPAEGVYKAQTVKQTLDVKYGG